MLRAHPTRLETRRAVLGYLWCSRGAFRPEIVNAVGLTEASISRIVAELKAGGVLEESKRTALYQGGTSAFFSLSKNIHIGAFEISNSRIHVGVGTLAGDIIHADRHELPDGSSSDHVKAVMLRAVLDLRRWATDRGIALEQIAVSIPGFHPGKSGNAIIALDPDLVAKAIADSFPAVPVTFANSIITRAVLHRLQLGAGHAGGTYLHVFAGHGIGAALVNELAESGSIQPMEIGHMVLDMNGPPCRCGHRGCLEAFASTLRIAEALRIEENAILAAGDRWASEMRIPAKPMKTIHDMLVRIGVAIGNAVNLVPVQRVVVTGWPAGLPGDTLAFIRDGVGRSLLGPLAGLDLSVAPAAMGREPASGLALAAYAFLQNGGERPADENGRKASPSTPQELMSA